MSRSRLLRATLLSLAAGTLLLAACGGDDSGDAGSDDPTTTAAPDDTSGSVDQGDDGGEPSQSELEALDAQAICDAVTADIVGDALGLEVTSADTSEMSTPQCSYLFDSGSGGQSNITIASMRPEDVGDATGDEGFDYIVRVNRGVAAGTEVEETEIDAGEHALLISGEALQLGVLQAGNHILTFIVPTDVEVSAAEALMQAAAVAIS
jgi:hypothetical protein